LARWTQSSIPSPRFLGSSAPRLTQRSASREAFMPSPKRQHDGRLNSVVHSRALTSSSKRNSRSRLGRGCTGCEKTPHCSAIPVGRAGSRLGAGRSCRTDWGPSKSLLGLLAPAPVTIVTLHCSGTGIQFASYDVPYSGIASTRRASWSNGIRQPGRI